MAEPEEPAVNPWQNGDGTASIESSVVNSNGASSSPGQRKSASQLADEYAKELLEFKLEDDLNTTVHEPEDDLETTVDEFEDAAEVHEDENLVHGDVVADIEDFNAKITELEWNEEPIITYAGFGELKRNKYLPPRQLQKFWAKVSDYAHSKKIIPSSLKPFMSKPPYHDYIMDYMFYSEPQREHYAPRLDQCVELVDDAIDALKDDAPHWNCVSHYPALRCAVRNMGKQRGVKVNNIAMSDIKPIWLSRDRTGSAEVGMRVDFVLALALPYSELLMLRKHGFKNLNHFDHQGIFADPVAVSIRTTGRHEGYAKSQYELSIWAAAQFRRLEAIFGDDQVAKLPFIPLVCVEGEKWHFFAATRRAKTKHNSVSKTIIWTHIQFGDITDVVGAFQIIAVLQLLVEWTDMTFKNWFVQCVREMDDRKEQELHVPR